MDKVARCLKRVFDILVAGGLLVVLGPVLIAIAVTVRLRMGAPVLFVQTRTGYRGRPFKILKFRTMRNLRGVGGEMLEDSRRLTSFGKWLRASSLDELPELMNVLLGDMSLVGPRPLLPEYLPLYSVRQSLRHEVVPGLTGWAQVNGRNALSWEDRLELDAWYVDHWSLGLDVRILLRTLMTVVRSEGITAAGHVSMEKFTGSKSAAKSDSGDEP